MYLVVNEVRMVVLDADMSNCAPICIVLKPTHSSRLQMKADLATCGELVYLIFSRK